MGILVVMVIGLRRVVVNEELGLGFGKIEEEREWWGLGWGWGWGWRVKQLDTMMIDTKKEIQMGMESEESMFKALGIDDEWWVMYIIFMSLSAVEIL